MYTKQEAIDKACLFILMWENQGKIEILDKEFFADMYEKYKYEKNKVKEN